MLFRSSIDGQGRVLIPPSLREYAQLEKDIVLAGMLKNIEIWSKDRFEERMKQAVGEIDKCADFIADLGI